MVTQALIQGNGNGTTSNANGLLLTGADTTNNSNTRILAQRFWVAPPINTQSFSLFNGCGTIIATFGSSAPVIPDDIYLNGQEVSSYVVSLQNASAGLQTVGNYQIGGAAANNGTSGRGAPRI